MITRFASLTILFVFGSQFGMAQPNRNIDSLLKTLNTMKEDSIKINRLNELSRHFSQDFKYKDSRIYADKAMALAQKLNFRPGLATAYFNLGEVERNHNNFPEALRYYEASIEIWKVLQNKRGL